MSFAAAAAIQEARTVGYIAIGVVGLCLGLFVAGIVAGYQTGLEVSDEKWRKSCIQHGYAEYHQKTGAWQWKEAGNHVD